tara:strand:+ start:377 stop:670 length:294 start_codon:yes stop_codon:yes gene_type:complete
MVFVLSFMPFIIVVNNEPFDDKNFDHKNYSDNSDGKNFDDQDFKIPSPSICFTTTEEDCPQVYSTCGPQNHYQHQASHVYMELLSHKTQPTATLNQW